MPPCIDARIMNCLNLIGNKNMKTFSLDFVILMIRVFFYEEQQSKKCSFESGIKNKNRLKKKTFQSYEQVSCM